ncbi:MAG: hypothetical protein GXP62_05610 [Oligoflexia bacterium]|nr:hypothetical protein [Oligoflexia bacterium]
MVKQEHAATRPGRLALALTCAGILGLALGCGGLDSITPSKVLKKVEGTSAPEASGSARWAGSKAPVYVMLFAHHYLGLGGYYPSAAQVRAVAEACVDQDMAKVCTLFFDGLLVQRIQKEDPSLRDYLREHDFPIGYHGEEAHGPYPNVVSMTQLNRGGRPNQEVAVVGQTFDQTVDAIQRRYCHGFRSYQLDTANYLVRNVGGETDDSTSGGMCAVRDWLGEDIDIMPGHALFSPPATFAFDQISDFGMFQGAGPLAHHFLVNTKNPALIERTDAFLGADTTLFWYMGKLTGKGTETTMLPMWTTDDLVQKLSRGGGGKRSPASRDGEPDRRQPAAGQGRRGRRPRIDGRNYLGPHLLPWTLPSFDKGLLDGWSSWLAQAQAPRTGGAPSRGARRNRPPKNADGSWPKLDSEAQDQAPAGKGGQRGQGGQGGQGASSPKRGSGSPGSEVQVATTQLGRRVPQYVSMKIDGNKQNVEAELAWFKSWQASDPGVQFVTARTIREKVESPLIRAKASDVASAVRSSWQNGPPDTLTLGGTAISSADAFEIMVRGLAGDSGNVQTTGVMGPTAAEAALAQGTGTVSAADVKAAAATVVSSIEASKWHAMPVNVKVGRTVVGFHQYQWLMSQAILDPGARSITVPTASYAPPYIRFVEDELGRANRDEAFWTECQFWTIKPATWKR